ncbi:MAG: CoA pyrophosphatase [Schleiferiaceae bacterium]
MTLTEAVQRIKESMEGGAPGQDWQYKMVPPGRDRSDLESIRKENPKRAGVLALFSPVEEEAHLTFILRNSYPGVHSAQIGFPGGKVEPSDDDLWDTALRETEEELGIGRDLITGLGALTEVYIPPSNFLVQPFVGFMESKPNYVPDEREVNEVFSLSLSDLLSEQNFVQTQVSVGGYKVQVPAFELGGRTIWGATAMMVSEIKAIFKM